MSSGAVAIDSYGLAELEILADVRPRRGEMSIALVRSSPSFATCGRAVLRRRRTGFG